MCSCNGRQAAQQTSVSVFEPPITSPAPSVKKQVSKHKQLHRCVNLHKHWHTVIHSKLSQSLPDKYCSKLWTTKARAKQIYSAGLNAI